MMKKHTTLILSLAFLMNLNSCATPSSASQVPWSESSFVTIEDENNSIFNYPLEYELFVPGNDVISYSSIPFCPTKGRDWKHIREVLKR